MLDTLQEAQEMKAEEEHLATCHFCGLTEDESEMRDEDYLWPGGFAGRVSACRNRHDCHERTIAWFKRLSIQEPEAVK